MNILIIFTKPFKKNKKILRYNLGGTIGMIKADT